MVKNDFVQTPKYVLVSQRPTCIYLPADLRELVDRIAATSGTSRSAVIQGAIRKALAEPKNDKQETK